MSWRSSLRSRQARHALVTTPGATRFYRSTGVDRVAVAGVAAAGAAARMAAARDHRLQRLHCDQQDLFRARPGRRDDRLGRHRARLAGVRPALRRRQLHAVDRVPRPLARTRHGPRRCACPARFAARLGRPTRGSPRSGSPPAPRSPRRAATRCSTRPAIAALRRCSQRSAGATAPHARRRRRSRSRAAGRAGDGSAGANLGRLAPDGLAARRLPAAGLAHLNNVHLPGPADSRRRIIRPFRSGTALAVDRTGPDPPQSDSDGPDAARKRQAADLHRRAAGRAPARAA